MDLEQELRTAVGYLRSGALNGEAGVRNTCIDPILRALDWPCNNPNEVQPEFPVTEGKVDYALCRAHDGKPLVFIEAKRLGNVTDQGEEQLFNYASHKGVPLLILTDGNIWDFYLSMADGIFAERQFYHMELERTDKLAEYADVLKKYLLKKHVLSGKARHDAEKFRESTRERRKARDALSDVWRNLLSGPDDLLLDLLLEAVEGECGTKPEIADVVGFLKQQISGKQTDAMPVKPLQSGSRPSRTAAKAYGNKHKKTRRAKIIGYTLDGKDYQTGSGIDTLGKILKEFSRRDSRFMKKLDPITQGRTQRLIAQRPEDVSNNPEAVRRAWDLKNGWHLNTYLSTAGIERHIQAACKVASVRFGSQLQLIERQR